MQLTLAQLRKLSFPYSFEEELDLSNELNGFEDIKSSSLVSVSYLIKERGIDTYLVKFKIHVDLASERPLSRTIDFWDVWKQPFNVNLDNTVEEYLKTE